MQLQHSNHQLSLNATGPTSRVIFAFALIFCLTTFASPALALLLGLVIAQLIGNPFSQISHKATAILLQASVVGLGFGINVHSAIQAGSQGVWFTVASITTTLILGYFTGRWFNIDKKTSYLISAGTAICGGSAIAAISPVIKAEEKQISVALGCVFILNAIALFVFPVIGHYLNLSQTQFGLWCAIAIHDTSSVVGASSKYGPHALEVATTVKLARALWIIPVALLSARLFKSGSKNVSIPWFIGLFIVAMVLNSYLPGIKPAGAFITTVAKTGLTVTLFLIGSGLTRQVFLSVGLRPFLQGLLLWIFIASAALFAVMHLV